MKMNDVKTLKFVLVVEKGGSMMLVKREGTSKNTWVAASQTRFPDLKDPNRGQAQRRVKLHSTCTAKHRSKATRIDYRVGSECRTTDEKDVKNKRGL